MKHLYIVIDEPDMVELVNLVRNGQRPVAVLRRKLGRRKADKEISRMKEKVLTLKLAIGEYLDDPIKAECNFIKECLGIHNGRQRQCFGLGDNIEVKILPTNKIILIDRGGIQ